MMDDDASTTVRITPLYAAPAGQVRPLRVVLVVPRHVPHWIRVFCEQAEGNDWLDLFTVAAPGSELPTVAGVRTDIRALVACERAVFGGDPSLALDTMPAVPFDATTSEGALTPLSARVVALLPDLVLVAGPKDLASTIAQQAAWSCWQVDSSLTDPDYAGLSLLAPLVRDERATQMELVLQGLPESPLVLAGSWGKTRGESFLMQRRDAFRKLPPLLLRALHGVAVGSVPATPGVLAVLQLRPMQSPLGLAAGVRVLRSTSRSMLRSLIKRVRKEREWMLVLRNGGTMLDPQTPAVGSHSILRAPRGWWADPYVVAVDGRKLLFVEEMADPKINKGTIACIELTDGAACRLGLALDEPGHLSFPQVFQWSGQWYMTVESRYARRVSLYRAVEFPLGWERIQDLVTGRVCVDPTLHHHDGRWYLFANVAETGNSTWDELFLFVADSLDGPFMPHPANPIVSDVRGARMAGRLFQHQGRLIRPAQDCAPGYGAAVVFNEVLELGPTVYRERALSRLAPEWATTLDGCHTYNADGGIEILDVIGTLPAGAACLPVFDAGFDASSAESASRKHGQVVGSRSAGSSAAAG